jgi:hypothetical protein
MIVRRQDEDRDRRLQAENAERQRRSQRKRSNNSRLQGPKELREMQCGNGGGDLLHKRRSSEQRLGVPVPSFANCNSTRTHVHGNP